MPKKCYWLWWRLSSVLWGILFKAMNSCTDIYSLSINFAGRLHRHVPWPADVPFTLSRLDTQNVVMFWQGNKSQHIRKHNVRMHDTLLLHHTLLRALFSPHFLFCTLSVLHYCTHACKRLKGSLKGTFKYNYLKGPRLRCCTHAKNTSCANSTWGCMLPHYFTTGCSGRRRAPEGDSSLVVIWIMICSCIKPLQWFRCVITYNSNMCGQK